MKKFTISILLLQTLYTNAQKTGIGTTTPATVLDVRGQNNWDLVGGEGDFRIGNDAYRIKFGVALGGGGAGSGAIMQYGQPGGYNVLSIGSQGNYMMQFNGSVNRIGVGTDNPGGKMEIKSGNAGEPQLQLNQTNAADLSRLRLTTNGGRYYDVAAYIGASAETDRLHFFHSSGGNTLTITGDNRVGIGNTSPNASLAFAASLGKKITLYPGATGDAGFGISGNRLQIFSDNPNADVAIGYDAAGTFNERFAFKPNGALALGGNLGAAGQVLFSNAGNAASWGNVRPTFYSFRQSDYQLSMPNNSSSLGEPTGWYVMAGLHYQPITLTQTSTVKLSVKLPVDNPSNTFGGTGTAAVYLGLYDASSNYIDYDIVYMYVGEGNINDGVTCNVKINLPAGTYYTHVKIRKFNGEELATGGYYTGLDVGRLVVEVYPQ